MISRRYRVQEKRTARRAVLLIASSVVLLLVLLFFGIPALVRFAVFVGELRSSSAPILQEDRTPPAPPYINQPLLYTREDRTTITGVAEAGSTLKVRQGGNVLKEIIVDDTSSFSIEVKLSPGKNTFLVTATDKAGNESEATGLDITLDREPPTLEIEKPGDGETVYEASITVEGKTETNARVTVNDRVAIVGSEGSFSQTVGLSEGENTIIVKATDEAGNEAETALTVNYTP